MKPRNKSDGWNDRGNVFMSMCMGLFFVYGGICMCVDGNEIASLICGLGGSALIALTFAMREP